MFTLCDHRLHLADEPLPRDVDAAGVRTLLAEGVACQPPVHGSVYGTLLNDRAALAALGDALHAAPYKAPPRAPVLYLKPRNTLAGHGARIVVPDDTEGLQAGASLGIVIGRTASRVTPGDAFDYVAGYTLVVDLAVPHASVYRPSVRFRARDGFCVVGPALVARRHVRNPDELSIDVCIEGREAFHASTASSVRGVAQLLADVTDFMTLAPGDVLTLGVPHGVPIVRAGDEVVFSIAGWAPLRVSFVSAVQRNGEPQ
ncbi:fumarylacetoacetate hydrolase family protein [Paraburkholderia phosphatilytica]|uniref:fumarylacetoacetate hydrolase family protein n=1 Tax=Paraburkholderia phosphatilytica TaxID=2282883 RepID=UPI000E525ADD|nr:fumarylacetoacetate hydrolase family protein [Paraburkholderia phosphatilytica]